ncbi:MAG: hypothetical protein ACRD12_01660 [Acidimicrobiales bacterium]
MPHGPAVTPPARQCGRCRKTFAGEAGTDAAPLAEWWICDDCRLVLLPGRRGNVAVAPAVEPG